MRRRAVLVILVLAVAGRAYAQEALTGPLPKSELDKGQVSLQLGGIFGELDDPKVDFIGGSLQILYALHPRAGINVKATYLQDREDAADNELISVGASVAYEVIPGAPGPIRTAPITFFAGMGVSLIDFDAGGIIIDGEEDMYVEAGLQGDFNFTEGFRVTPFLGTTVVLGDEENETILGLGGMFQLLVGEGIRIFALGVIQENDVSDLWYVSAGVVFEFGGPRRPEMLVEDIPIR